MLPCLVIIQKSIIMKTIQLSRFVSLITLFAIGTLHARTVREQLTAINSYWNTVGKEVKHPMLGTHKRFVSDRALIQTHLELVELHLRSHTPANLTADQRKKRTLCLDYLRAYRIRGEFPKNTFHCKRTPYFRDINGTNCAVGQLIVSTGHADLSKRISQTQNYNYLSDIKDPAILSWAREYGMQLDELKWIQPTYASDFCGDTGCVYTLRASVWSSAKPKKFLWSNGDTTETATKICPKMTYSLSVWDSLGNLIPDSMYYIGYGMYIDRGSKFTFPAIEPFYAKIVKEDSKENCTGTATASITIGDASGASFYWSHNGKNQSKLENLCPGIYYVGVRNSKGCRYYDSIEIKSSRASIDVDKLSQRAYLYPTISSSYFDVHLPK